MNASYVYESSIKALQSYCNDNNSDFNKIFNNIYEWKSNRNRMENQLTILADMIIAAREEMLKKDSGSVLSALKRIFKDCEANEKESLHTTWIDKNNYQCMCANVYAVRLHNRFDCFPIMEKQDNGFTPIDLGGVINPTKSYEYQIKLPTSAELKLFIADKKARGITLKNNKNEYIYKFDGIELYVNPKLLLNMIEALPNATAKYNGSMLSCIYFKAENGDGVLCPIMPAK